MLTIFNNKLRHTIVQCTQSIFIDAEQLVMHLFLIFDIRVENTQLSRCVHILMIRYKMFPIYLFPFFIPENFIP